MENITENMWVRIGLEPYILFSETMNQATLQPSKDLIEAGFMSKAYYGKIASNLSPKDFFINFIDTDMEF